MEIPEEIRDKIDRKMIYRLRDYNPYIMAMGGVMFFAIGVGGGVFGWHEVGPYQAVLMIAGGIVFSFIFLYLGLDNRVKYEITPEGITLIPVFESVMAMKWAEVSKLDSHWLPGVTAVGSGEMRIFGKHKRPIKIDDKVPRIREISLLVQYHLRAHGKDEIVEKYIMKIHT